MGATEDLNKWMTKVVVLKKNGAKIVGEYDGYGNVGHSEEDSDVFGYGNPVAYHKACWLALGKPEFDGKPSEHASDQGWFFNDGIHNKPEPKTPADVEAIRANEFDQDNESEQNG